MTDKIEFEVMIGNEVGPLDGRKIWKDMHETDLFDDVFVQIDIYRDGQLTGTVVKNEEEAIPHFILGFNHKCRPVNGTHRILGLKKDGEWAYRPHHTSC